MTEYSNLFVCLMGIGTVFVGLICIIALCMLMSAVIRGIEAKNTVALPQAPTAATVPALTPELVAAMSAVIAEDMGVDVSAIRISSIKKL